MQLNLETFRDDQACENEFLKLFSKSWIFVGLLDEVEAENSYKLIKFGQKAFILKNESDGPKLYSNVCPHRGSEIIKCSGQGKLKCPYHGWHFGASGKVFVNRKNTFEKLNEDLGLFSYRTALVGKFVFATRGLDVQPIESFLGEHFEYLKFVSEKMINRIDKNEMIIDANWKIVVENTLESYHVGDVHQETLAPYFAGVSHAKFNSVHSEVVEELTPTMTGNLKKVQKSFFVETDFDQYRHVHIFPNLTIASSGYTNFFVQEFLPINAKRSMFVSHGFLPEFKEKISGPIKKTFSETSKEFNRQVFLEDKWVCESVQRGYLASLNAEIHLVFNSFEKRVENFALNIRKFTL